MRKVLLSFAVITTLVVPLVAFAATAPQPNIDGKPVTLDKLETFVKDVMDSLITIVSLVVVGAFIYAGFLMVTAGDNAAQFGKGKTALKHAAIGAAIVFGVGVIVNTIANFAGDPTGTGGVQQLPIQNRNMNQLGR